MKVSKKVVSVTAIVGVLALGISSADAGWKFPKKLFGAPGKGALISGTPGAFVEKKINPVATPIVRGAVVAGATVVGVAVGTAVGAPTAGGAIGAAAGGGINEVAAGEKL